MAYNQHAQEFEELLKGYRALKLRIIQQAAGMALTHFKESFTNQGFTDERLVKWQERKGPFNKGSGILIKRGILKRGLRIKRTSLDGAVVGEDDGIPYADTHNFGGQIKITPQMRRFFWAMYYKYGGGKAKGKSKAALASNEFAEFYKNMALTKEQFIKIPKRQFIGDSATLERKLKAYITGELDKLFKIE